MIHFVSPGKPLTLLEIENILIRRFKEDSFLAQFFPPTIGPDGNEMKLAENELIPRDSDVRTYRHELCDFLLDPLPSPDAQYIRSVRLDEKVR